MVVNTYSDSYTPFQTSINPEDSAQSSEDSSGVHSPVFTAGNYPAHNDSFRYSQEHPHATGVIGSQYDYGQNLVTQPPTMLDTSLNFPSSSTRIPFSPHYPIQSRSHMDFHPHSGSRMAAGISPPDYDSNPPPGRHLASHNSYAHSAQHPFVVSAGSGPSDMQGIDSMPSTSSNNLRKETSSIVIACRQCRGRKIRCDSIRPNCSNCVRRSNKCEYDEKPRRRGPDKRPGTRQRSCKKRPTDGTFPLSKRKKFNEELLAESGQETQLRDDDSVSPNSRTMDEYSSKFYHSNLPPANHPSSREPRINEYPPKHEVPPVNRRNASYGYDQDFRRNVEPMTRSLEREQRAQWDAILESHPLNFIFDELSFVVNNTGNVLFFINLDYVVKRLYSEERLHIQPAFIYAVLGLAKLLRSSKLENGSNGLTRAFEFIRQAHIAYNDAVDLRWSDVTLAEAAFMLALFELSARPQYSSERIRTSLITLDNLIRDLSLTSIDSQDRIACRFLPGTVPSVTDVSSQRLTKDHKCSCLPPDPHHTQHRRDCALPWDPNWSPWEVADEEARRLCWSTLALVSDYIAHCETFGEDYPLFYVTEPSNYLLLFPGENLDRRPSGALSPKESLWALYCRSLLLWNFCRLISDRNSGKELSEIANDVDLEAQTIENALNVHKCKSDMDLLYSCQLYVHNIRMSIAISSSPGSPGSPGTSDLIFKREQAQEWLYYSERIFQHMVAISHHLTGPDGEQLTRHPYRISWFMNRLSDCLVLWHQDTTLDDALRLGKLIAHVLDVMHELWPCPPLQDKSDSLCRQLSEACNSKTINGPSSGINLPPQLS